MNSSISSVTSLLPTSSLLPILTEGVESAASQAQSGPALGLKLALEEKPDGDLSKRVLENSVVNFYLQDTCPVSCHGCAAAPVDGGADSSKKAKSADYRDVEGLLDYAKDLGVKLQVNFIGDFDPAFLKFSDEGTKRFSDVLKHTVDGGHTILFPIATTGSWGDKLSEDSTTKLGELDSKYRASLGADGKTSSSYFVLSMPRRNSGMFNIKFGGDADDGIARYIDMTLHNIDLLAKKGQLKVNVNYNDKDFPGDRDVAEGIKSSIEARLAADVQSNVELRIVPFVGEESTPDCCKVQSNWLQVSRDGFRTVASSQDEAGRYQWASQPVNLKSAIETLAKINPVP